jgi:DNA-binding MarR family transcriptional regulator
MEEAGLIVRRPDAADARLVRLYLTLRTRAAREPVRAALTKIIAQLQDGPL